MRGSLVLLLFATLVAHAARAEVAVAVSIPDVNAVHRDFAAGIIDEASARFAMQSPTLPPEQLSACGSDEKCLVEAALRTAATHVLVIGLAAIGPAEFVVSVKLFDARTGATLCNLSDLASPGRDPREAGRALGKTAFASVTGVPVAQSTPPAAQGEAAAVAVDPHYSGFSALSLAGWGIVGASAITAAVGVGAAVYLQQTSAQDQRGMTGVIAGAVGAGLAVGLGLVVLDQLMAEPASDG